MLRSLRVHYGRLKGELEAIRSPAKWLTRRARDRKVFASQADERARRAAEIVRDMAAIEHVILLFDPDWDAGVEPSIAPRRKHSALPMGGFSEAAFDVLREAAVPLTTKGIVIRICKNLGLSRSGAFNRERMRDTVGRALSNQPDLIAHDGGSPKKWWIKPESEDTQAR